MSEGAPTWLVTGGAGFIGASFVAAEIARGARVVTLDALTYAGNADNLAALADDPRHVFVHGDICDAALVADLLARHAPDGIVHLAAESHVDRSIHDAAAFVRTNIVGTHVLLDAALRHVRTLDPARAAAFRFVHVSTDEVYGSLGPHDAPFDEASPYAPNSPYAASKAGSDHLARAWHRTYGLPVIITHASNNYGPYQFPEKLIPLMILNALEGKALPVYGDGHNVRDWLYVGDHADALGLVVRHGRPGEVYGIGGGAERTNLDVVTRLCDLVDLLAPPTPARARPRRELITFVSDRPGHDRRYALDAGKVTRELGWRPRETFESGLEKTVVWYLDHALWTARVRSGDYRRWLETNYGDRGGGRDDGGSAS